MIVTIEDISWERVFLRVTYRADKPVQLKLFRVRTRQFADFRETQEGDLVTAVVNITQGGGREPLADGEWIICQRLSDEEASLSWARANAPYLVTLAKKRLWGELKPHRRRKLRNAGVDYATYSFTDGQIDEDIRSCPFTTHRIAYAPQLTERLGDLSRVFRYVNGKYALAASLIPSMDASDYLIVKLAIDYFVKNRKPQTRRFSLRQMEKNLFSLYYKLARKVLRPKDNVVLFFKENGDEPTENLAAVRDRLMERGLDKEFPVIERYRNTFGGHQNFFSWIKDINVIARSRYIFIDDYCPVFNFIDPDDDTVLIQVWHAGVGFKSVGYARFGISGSPDPYQSAHRRYDYALVGNGQLRDIYSEVFGIEQEALLATGMPRLDHFLDDERQTAAEQRLLAKYPWMGDGRVIVFAPTFRGAGQATAYYPYDSYIDYQALWEMCERTNSYFVFEMPGDTVRFRESLEGSLGRELGRLALCGRCPGDGLLLLLLRLPSAAETRGLLRARQGGVLGYAWRAALGGRYGAGGGVRHVRRVRGRARESRLPLDGAGRIDDRSLLGAGGLCGRPRH